MTQNSTRVTRLVDTVHVAGECCEQWICSWCGSRKHVQGIVTDGEVVGVDEACESCDSAKFWEPVNGAKKQ